MNISCTKINPSSIISSAPPDYCDYWCEGHASSCCGGKARSALGSGEADAVFPLMDTISGYLGFWALGCGVYFGWGNYSYRLQGFMAFRIAVLFALVCASCAGAVNAGVCCGILLYALWCTLLFVILDSVCILVPYFF